MPKIQQPSYLNFDTGSYPWEPDVDYRRHPEKYKVYPLLPQRGHPIHDQAGFQFLSA